MKEEHHVNITLVLHDRPNSCYTCVKFIVRTVNIIEKIESKSVIFKIKLERFNTIFSKGTCRSVPPGMEPTADRICQGLNSDQQLKTMFSENYVPVNCRSSLEGVWQFAYQNRFRFTGECNHPDAYIRSCQLAGTQFLITNQKFNITYKRCDGLAGTFDGRELNKKLLKLLIYKGVQILN
jgi:hypothetical protein